MVLASIALNSPTDHILLRLVLDFILFWCAPYNKALVIQASENCFFCCGCGVLFYLMFQYFISDVLQSHGLFNHPWLVNLAQMSSTCWKAVWVILNWCWLYGFYMVWLFYHWLNMVWRCLTFLFTIPFCFVCLTQTKVLDLAPLGSFFFRWGAAIDLSSFACCGSSPSCALDLGFWVFGP